jgi:hypothetical protein
MFVRHAGKRLPPHSTRRYSGRNRQPVSESNATFAPETAADTHPVLIFLRGGAFITGQDQNGDVAGRS